MCVMAITKISSYPTANALLCNHITIRHIRYALYTIVRYNSRYQVYTSCKYIVRVLQQQRNTKIYTYTFFFKTDLFTFCRNYYKHRLILHKHRYRFCCANKRCFSIFWVRVPICVSGFFFTFVNDDLVYYIVALSTYFFHLSIVYVYTSIYASVEIQSMDEEKIAYTQVIILSEDTA